MRGGRFLQKFSSNRNIYRHESETSRVILTFFGAHGPYKIRDHVASLHPQPLISWIAHPGHSRCIYIHPRLPGIASPAYRRPDTYITLTLLACRFTSHHHAVFPVSPRQGRRVRIRWPDGELWRIHLSRRIFTQQPSTTYHNGMSVLSPQVRIFHLPGSR